MTLNGPQPSYSGAEIIKLFFSPERGYRNKLELLKYIFTYKMLFIIKFIFSCPLSVFVCFRLPLLCLGALLAELASHRTVFVLFVAL